VKPTKNKLYSVARILIILAGCFPLIVGTYFFSQNIIHSRFNMIEHVAFTNLVSTGVTIITLGVFALPLNKTWVLSLLLFVLLWTGGNDSYALMRNYFTGSGLFPFAIFPSSLGIIALFLLSLDLRHE